jgi:hypothetical protein
MQLSDLRTSQPGSRGRRLVTLAAAALSFSVAAGGCGPGPEVRAGGGELLTEGARRAAPTPARLRSGTALVRDAATAYASGAYRTHPPTLPGETASVASDLSGAAGRVPDARRGLRPRLRRLRMTVVGVDRLRASLVIDDGMFRPFTVAMELHWRRGWRVVAISLPD